MKSSLFVKRLHKTKLLLPPLTGFTDYPYRTILSGFNPPFLTTEMINARALLHKNPRTMQMIKRVDCAIPQGVQLLGKDPASMAQAAEMVEALGFDYIDINMGCTIAKVVSRGEGVALMSNEDTASSVVSAVCKAVSLPVTVKLRLGASRKAQNALSLSKKLVDAGTVALTVHGRTGEKKFGSGLDWSAIKGVVEHVSAPVVANGGIFNEDDAKEALFKTDAAAVMPGRGLIGNPWLVPELTCAFSGKAFCAPTLSEKKEICFKHAQALCTHYGERRGILHMRKILPKYFSSTVHLKGLKHDVQHITNINDAKLMLGRIKESDSKCCYEKK